MPGDVNVAAVAALLADPTRTAILMALLDGRAWPAGDLARAAHVTPSTASNHLTKLVEHRLLCVEQQGRHRYFRLADPAIAQALEALAGLAPASPVHSLRDSEAARAIRAARMCYNHLAGKLGVALSQALVEQEVLAKVDGGYLVTEQGERWLREVGIDCSALKKQGQLFAPHHIDWSERRYHLAGALGAALAQRFIERGWVRRALHSRAVHLTEEGEQTLLQELGLRLSDGKDAISA
ncbi:MAG TPA: metalloregulator ArsR/SmtB family transcription factor [Ktedonobacterales bacterium]|nr:metalloregulator ArsR/SmtB family transcription factor [Ktedonobacterales bacterium]